MEGKNELQQVCETVLALQKGIEGVDSYLAKVDGAVKALEARLKEDALQERLAACEKKLSGITAELKKITDLTEKLEAEPGLETLQDKLDRILAQQEKILAAQEARQRPAAGLCQPLEVSL